MNKTCYIVGGLLLSGMMQAAEPKPQTTINIINGFKAGITYNFTIKKNPASEYPDIPSKSGTIQGGEIAYFLIPTATGMNARTTKYELTIRAEGLENALVKGTPRGKTITVQVQPIQTIGITQKTEED